MNKYVSLFFKLLIVTMAAIISIMANVAFNSKYQIVEIESVPHQSVITEEIPISCYFEDEEAIVETEKEEVYFTSYYYGDGSSTTTTGSGLSIRNFEVNNKGWYTYEGKVVVATATHEGLASNYGVLAKYKKPSDGIKYFNYYDELEIEIDGDVYTAIVLDTCGASMNIDYLIKNDKGINRIDIFVSSKANSVGKVKGYAYENS